jgi:hypothetical protein
MTFTISTDPTLPPTRGIAVGKRRASDHMIMSIIAVFSDRKEAEAWMQSANEWYGKDHPLWPLQIVADNLLIGPNPFPVAALIASRESEAKNLAEAAQASHVADVEEQLRAAASLPDMPF